MLSKKFLRAVAGLSILAAIPACGSKAEHDFESGEGDPMVEAIKAHPDLAKMGDIDTRDFTGVPVLSISPDTFIGKCETTDGNLYRQDENSPRGIVTIGGALKDLQTPGMQEKLATFKHDCIDQFRQAAKIDKDNIESGVKYKSSLEYRLQFKYGMRPAETPYVTTNLNDAVGSAQSLRLSR